MNKAWARPDLVVRLNRAAEHGVPTIGFEIWSRSQMRRIERARGFLANRGAYGPDAAEAVEIALRRLCGESAHAG